MIGVYDFCGHYEWTFEWLRQQGGEELVRDYWDTAIHRDAQRHATGLIRAQGFAGMAEYWGHTLEEENAGCTTTLTPTRFRLDMHVCPSKGFLIHNDLEQYHDYCDHCIGWIGPMMHDAGFVIDHQHNHRGQCWWEMRRPQEEAGPSTPGEIAPVADVRLQPDWVRPEDTLDTFLGATGPQDRI